MLRDLFCPYALGSVRVIMRSWKMRLVSLLRSSFWGLARGERGEILSLDAWRSGRISTLHSGGKKEKWTLARWSNSHGQHQIKPIYGRNTLLICFFRNTFVCSALSYTKTNKSSLSSFIWKHHSFLDLSFGLRSNWPCQRLINKHHCFPGNAQHRFEQPERSQKLYDIIAWQTQRERERDLLQTIHSLSVSLPLSVYKCMWASSESGVPDSCPVQSHI